MKTGESKLIVLSYDHLCRKLNESTKIVAFFLCFLHFQNFILIFISRKSFRTNCGRKPRVGHPPCSGLPDPLQSVFNCLKTGMKT